MWISWLWNLGPRARNWSVLPETCHLASIGHVKEERHVGGKMQTGATLFEDTMGHCQGECFKNLAREYHLGMVLMGKETTKIL